MELQKFYEWLQLNKNSVETIDSYYKNVNRFGKFCDYMFTQENLNKYIIKMKEENKSPATINLFLISIRAYVKYSGKELDIPIPKRVKRGAIKFYFTEEDFNFLLKSYYSEKDLLLRFMFYTGVRPSELLNLKVCDINFEKKIINILNAKGNKDRVIPFLNTKLYNDLKIHCNSVEEKVFNMSYGQIKYLFKEIKKLLSINGIVEARTMRISFAKFCLSKGMDISYLSKLMGHTDIRITEGYAEPDEKMVKEICENIRTGKINNEDKKIKELEEIIKDLKEIIKSLKNKLKGE